MQHRKLFTHGGTITYQGLVQNITPLWNDNNKKLAHFDAIFQKSTYHTKRC